MQARRDALYKKLLLKFEDFEIVSVWQEFIGETIPLLEGLTNLTRILFNRYFDEYEKELDGKKEEAVIEDLLSKIKEIIRTQLENNVITDQYLYLHKISNIDLDYKTYLASYIENELQKKFIEELFFHSKLPNTIMDDISEFMREQFRANKHDEILRNLSEQIDLLEANEDLLIERNTNKGHYYAYYLSKTVETIGEEWWWQDTELFRAVYNQASGYFTNLIDLQISPSFRREIDELHNPLATANEIYFKCLFYYDMGVRTAIEGIHKQAGRYFSALLELTKKGDIYLKQIKGNKGREIKNRYERLVNKAELLEYNIKLSSLFGQINKNIENEDRTKLQVIISDVVGHLGSYTQKIEIKYLSGLPTLYESLISTLGLLVSMDKPFIELSEVLASRLRSFTLRIDVATNQLVDELEQMDGDSEIANTKIKVVQIMNDIEILIETVAMIPIHILERISIIKRLETIHALILSINEDIKAYEMKDKNIIRVLIHKAKANYHAEQSKNLLEEQNTQYLPEERIYAQFNGSLVSGYMNEIGLFQLCLQFLCINDILPKLITSFSNADKIKDHKQLLEELWSDLQFRNLLTQIRNDCEILLDHKQNIISYPIRGIQWNEVTQKRDVANALSSFYESIKFALVASVATINENYDDAHELFIQAQDMAFEASTSMQNLQSPVFVDYAKHVFSFGQFTQDSANKAKMRMKIRLPIQEVIKLFRDILFNL